MFSNIKNELSYALALNSSFLNGDIFIYIENEDDERFWNQIFKTVLPNKKITFDYYSHTGSQGKPAILKYAEYLELYGGKLLICLDSDFDYILDNEVINSNKHIIQTYAYSMENIMCHKKNLNYIVSMLSPGSIFCFEQFLSIYSEIVFDLFVLNVILKDKNDVFQALYKADFKVGDIITTDSFFDGLRCNISQEIAKIKNANNISDTLFNEMQNVLKDKIRLIGDVYLYVNGHVLFGFISQIMNAIRNERMCKLTINAKENINNKSNIDKGLMIKNKMSALHNDLVDVNTLIKTSFTHCFCGFDLYNKIVDDISNAVV